MVSTIFQVDQGDGNRTYDVSECIEAMGFGNYQYKLLFTMGLMSFADSGEIWLSSIIISGCSGNEFNNWIL